ncbi:MAG TPA: Hsp20/alpha crystallin family protein [Thermomicrobiales bacterium]|nr:Hsp20/alpha crystallin family protein [Thermomicrobiales bacterium]
MIVVRRVRPREQTRRHTDFDAMYRLLAGQRALNGGGRRVWRPAVEVYESGDSLEVVVEIAGMSPDDIDIALDDDILTIQGARPDRSACEHRSYHIAHIEYGDFAAELRLPFAVDSDAATASYDNGFLRVTLPRIKGRTIVPTRVSESSEESRDA